MNNNGIQGKRKLYATLVYTAGSIGIGSILVAFGKIPVEGWVSALDSAKYVVMCYLGVNAAGAAIQKFGKRE